MRLQVLDDNLIEDLNEKYGLLLRNIWSEEYTFKNPFKKLVITVLSQNTSNVNCIRAYKGLASKFKITPEVLASANLQKIKKSIRSGGLYNIKAKRIKQLSQVILERYNGDITPILDLPKEEAKKRFLELPGIGDKTADVLLTSRYSYSGVIPIDTHFDRVAKRLGMVDSKADYQDVQDAWMQFLPKDKRERLSGLIWLLAKYTCKSQNPKCFECPLSNICEFKKGK